MGKLESSICAPLCLLQLLPDSFDTSDHTGDGRWHHRSRMEHSRIADDRLMMIAWRNTACETLLVMRLQYYIVVFTLLVPHVALSQWVSFGVKGGVPISSESQTGPYVCANSVVGPICGNNYFAARPYAFGPTVEVFLPRKFSIEADFLYRRFHQDIAEGLLAPHGGPVTFGRRGGVAASAWLFPLLVKYSPLHRNISPFVTVGSTLRHLEPFEGQGLVIDVFLLPQPQSFHIDSEVGRSVDVSITAGAGVRLRQGFIDISPEIRFIHWTSGFQPAQNQALLMIGITFPARR
jgi:hypothetical protein